MVHLGARNGVAASGARSLTAMTDRTDPPPDADTRAHGLRARTRRAVGATVGRVAETVGDVAMDVTGSTAHQVIEELEPYLVEEAIPRILTDLTPALVEDLLPALLEDLRPYIEADLVPKVVDALMPHLGQQVAPELLEALMPTIREQIAPDLVEALMPMIEAEVAPRVLDSLMPKVRDEIAPDLLDALMPKVRDEIAPDLVDSLMPKIRTEVVPVIMDDIIDDPRVRDLIREQSQGLFLDALESLRENIADVDDVVEKVGRRLVRRAPRPEPESGLTLVLTATGGSARPGTRHTLDSLAEQRRVWREMPMPPAPPGREFAHAGAVTRLLSFAIDVTLVGWLVSQGLSAVVSLLESVFSPVPTWLMVGLGAVAASVVPIYLGLAWWLTGRSLGDWLVGTRVCTPDGRSPHFWRAVARGWLGSVGLIVWVVTGVMSFFQPKRNILLDVLLHTEVRYVVPDDQQRRYVREALQAEDAAGS